MKLYAVLFTAVVVIGCHGSTKIDRWGYTDHMNVTPTDPDQDPTVVSYVKKGWYDSKGKWIGDGPCGACGPHCTTADIPPCTVKVGK